MAHLLRQIILKPLSLCSDWHLEDCQCFTDGTGPKESQLAITGVDVEKVGAIFDFGD
jgi:hypothetical protein